MSAVEVVQMETNASFCDALLADKAGPPPEYPAGARYGLSAILVLFPVVTIMGNIVVILAVATHKRLRTITNVFVVSLAVADMSVAIFVMPFAIYQQLNNKVWLLGDVICRLASSFDVMLCTVSIFHLSCLAIDRYLAICRPFVHERLTKWIIVLMLLFCWVVPIFISFVPILNRWNLIGLEEYVACAMPPGTKACNFIVNIPFSIIGSCVAFYIPVIFMVACNYKIYMAARRQAMQIRTLENAAHHHKGKGKFKQETKAAKTLGIIMGCFSVCWFPFFIMNVIDPIIGYRIPYEVIITGVWLGYLNSMMNPFLYYYFNRNFKTAFRRIMHCKVCKGIRDYDDDMITGLGQGSE